MKGELFKTDGGWVVRGVTHLEPNETTYELPLHPIDVEQIHRDSLIFDNIEARIHSNPDVKFKIARIYEQVEPPEFFLDHWNPSKTYVKLVNTHNNDK